jgi:hypothetical protein
MNDLILVGLSDDLTVTDSPWPYVLWPRPETDQNRFSKGQGSQARTQLAAHTRAR